MRGVPGQLSLMGFEEKPALDRLFFALCVPSPVGEGIHRLTHSLKQQHGLSGKQVKPEHLHVTLHHLGDFASLPLGVVEAASRAADAVTAEPFELIFDGAGSFPNGRSFPYVLKASQNTEAVVAFQRKLGMAMAYQGIRGDKSFTPHVTTMYAQREVPDHSIEPVRWTARELVLVHSLLGQTTHIPLGRWPLGTGMA
ncbi:RNA 2',3'-cyclic phosphodiesterase [Ideonella sp. BN130291]|uniref:RNA 2',3'-cyclic phosphodiesterase n=1 Tax=Ideonella sp. BN130291 TaxID=3112940 RepID=UPI002E2763DE|nr:RNA 2',3'-cyclic phosphodiesterase [Ideonella sp. BN130291]